MDKRSLRLAFVGDVCLASLFQLPMPKDVEFSDWSAIRGEIGAVDFLVGNLECCLVDERCSVQARKQIMAVPAAANPLLGRLGFSDLCLANNHSLDCGQASMGCGARATTRVSGGRSTRRKASLSACIESPPGTSFN